MPKHYHRRRHLGLRIYPLQPMQGVLSLLFVDYEHGTERITDILKIPDIRSVPTPTSSTTTPSLYSYQIVVETLLDVLYLSRCLEKRVTNVEQQTPKEIEDGKPIASSTIETISSVDHYVIVVAAGAPPPSLNAKEIMMKDVPLSPFHYTLFFLSFLPSSVAFSFSVTAYILFLYSLAAAFLLLRCNRFRRLGLPLGSLGLLS
ncbi:hypothetical protein YC2023_012357 [Brassica napus]